MFIKRVPSPWFKPRRPSIVPLQLSEVIGQQQHETRAKRRAPSNVNNAESLQRTLGPLLAVAQCFGILPIRGVLTSNPRALHFSPSSFRTLYAYFLLISVAIMALLSLIHMASSLRSETFSVLGGLGAATGGAVFYGNACVTTWLFLRLSVRWPALMARWSEVEIRLDRGCGLIKTHCNIPGLSTHALSASVLLLATVEHALSIAINVKEAGNILDGSDWLKKYSLNSHAFIFSNIEYSRLGGIIILILSHFATFTWNFMDLFIILMSHALTQRFHQYNMRLLALEGKLMTRSEWREFREQFASLSALTHALDHDVSGITLLSFANNLYFICMQLLNGLSPTSKDPLVSIYFWGSFMFLMGRTGTVTLFASNVHHESKGALPTVFACPSDAFCDEVQRLQQHMCAEELALTGLGLFHVTRSFMLAVAGAIATYEVVLLQFNVAMATAPATSAPASLTGAASDT